MNGLDLSSSETRKLLEQASRIAAGYLAGMNDRPVMPQSNGAETSKLFRQALPQKGMGAAALDDLPSIFEHSRTQNSRFFGYVFGSAEPVGIAADLLISALNQNVTAWRSSPAAVTIEHTVVGWLAEATGCAGFTGSLTGGGSSANLMALAMAREALMPANRNGVRAGNGIIYASDQVHMSLLKAMALLGLGRENLRLLPSDENFRLSPQRLHEAISADRRAGKKPLAVVASAGTVNTGAIDPLSQISAVARKHGAWLHVDGAYGGLASLAAPEKFRGLERADSISLDAHKWLYQPVDCGCLLFKDAERARAAFADSGEYARPLTADPVEGFAFFEESLELSRRFRALKLWLALRYHGLSAFRDAIQKDLGHAQLLSAHISRHPELELLAPVELSAVCFRYRGHGNGVQPEAGLDRLNLAILQRTLDRGRVYISNASLRGKFALRVCIVNHRTGDADILAIVEEVLAAAAVIKEKS